MTDLTGENMGFKNIVFDYNGTLATDGKIEERVLDDLKSLSEKYSLFVLTADTFGTASEQMSDFSGEVVIIPEDRTGSKFKEEFIEKLGPDTVCAVGNGNNDRLMLRRASLGIAVLGDEGVAGAALKNAEILVADSRDALNLFLKPRRLKATLRK